MEKEFLLFERRSSSSTLTRHCGQLLDRSMHYEGVAALQLYGIERMLSKYFSERVRVGREHCSKVEAYPGTNENQVASSHTELGCLLYLQ